MKNSIHSAILAALVTGALGAIGAATMPAADYSEPKKAVASFLHAKDEAGLREALIIDPPAASAVEPFLGAMIATTNLQNAAQKQFASGAARYFSKGTDEEIAARIKSLNTADVKVTGSTATIELPPDETTHRSGDTILLRQTAGLWKIDAARLFGVDAATPETAAQNAKNTKIAEIITIVTNQMIREINAGKFASASDAYQEYWTRSKDAVSRPLAATSPTTTPATLSTTKAK